MEYREKVKQIKIAINKLYEENYDLEDRIDYNHATIYELTLELEDLENGNS